MYNRIKIDCLGIFTVSDHDYDCDFYRHFDDWLKNRLQNRVEFFLSDCPALISSGF